MNAWLDKLYKTFIVDDNYMMLVKGLGNTLLITLCALLIGIVIGSVIAIAKYYAEGNKKLKIVNVVCDIYTTAIRGIPVTVLLMIFYFVIIVSDTTGITTAIIAFGINSGAYMAELIRSGINAVDKGQMEAGRSLGFGFTQTMMCESSYNIFKIVLFIKRNLLDFKTLPSYHLNIVHLNMQITSRKKRLIYGIFIVNFRVCTFD